MFDDWCRRTPGLAFMLGMVVFVAGMSGLFFAFCVIPPQTADAKPVKSQAVPSASCVSGDYTDDTDDGVPKMRIDPEGTSECKVRLRNGRTVTCLELPGGISCDWDHAVPKKSE